MDKRVCVVGQIKEIVVICTDSLKYETITYVSCVGMVPDELVVDGEQGSEELQQIT